MKQSTLTVAPVRRKRESWQRPDPRRYYRFWRERFTVDEIRAMAAAIWGAP